MKTIHIFVSPQQLDTICLALLVTTADLDLYRDIRYWRKKADMVCISGQPAPQQIELDGSVVVPVRRET
jgi:hypothetical protein